MGNKEKLSARLVLNTERVRPVLKLDDNVWTHVILDLHTSESRTCAICCLNIKSFDMNFECLWVHGGWEVWTVFNGGVSMSRFNDGWILRSVKCLKFSIENVFFIKSRPLRSNKSPVENLGTLYMAHGDNFAQIKLTGLNSSVSRIDGGNKGYAAFCAVKRSRRPLSR